MNERRRLWLRRAAALVAAPCATRALAAYPERNVRIVVPGGAGGSTDAVARIPRPYAERDLGQPLVVENRIGAGGAVGTMEVVRSAPDGYTLLVASMGTHVLRPLLVRDAGYDTMRDLAPITRLVDVPGIILAAPGLPASNLRELIALAKASPAPLAYGTPGVGTSAHLIAELLCERAGLELLHVPYSSSGPCYADLIAGRLALAFSLVTGVHGYVASGRMKALAVTSRARIASLPSVPTVEESGIGEFDVTSWYGLMAPAGTAPATCERVQRAYATALRVPGVVDRLATLGATVVANSPLRFADDIRADYARWSAVIGAANIRL